MAGDSDALVDEAALRSLLVDFDRGEVREIVAVLRSQARELAAMQTSGGQEALERIADAAHRLHSTCAVVGARAVSTICGGVERAGRAGDVAGVQAALAELPARAERTATRLLARLEGGSG